MPAKNSSLQAVQFKQAPQPQPKPLKEVRAEAFVLVDSEGRERAELKTIPNVGYTDTVLSFHDEQGNLRLTLRDSHNESLLSIFGPVQGQPEEVLTVGYRPNLKGTLEPGVVIAHVAGTAPIRLQAEIGKEGKIEVMGLDGRQTLIDADGLTVWDAQENIVADIGVTPQAAPMGSYASRCQQLAEAMAAVIEHEECSVTAYDTITQLLTDWQGVCPLGSSVTHDARLIRHLLPTLLVHTPEKETEEVPA